MSFELIVERRLTDPWLQGALICGNHEALNRLGRDEAIHYFRDIRERDPSIKKVIWFD